LKKALDDCIVDVEALVKEIEQIEIEIDKVNKDTEAKIQLEPGTPAPVPAAKPDENESKMEAEPETPDKMEAKPETPDNKTAPTAEI
jgi:heme-binding NEAT domain protein